MDIEYATNDKGEIKLCKDCTQKIEFLCDFPGPRCLACHAKKTEHEPLERPDFTKALRHTR